MKPSNKNGQNSWTLSITGYKTEFARKKLTFIGAQVKTTLQTIIPNTIQRNIIKIFAPYYYIKLTA
jgi:hypothetical protein